MRRLKLQRNELHRYRLAALAGLLLSLAFPKFDVAGLAWIAPGLALAAAAGFSGGAAFRIGLIAGLVYHLSTLYWLLLIPMGLPWKGVVVLGWIALSAYLALFQGLWVWLAWKICPARSAGLRTGESEEAVLTATGRFSVDKGTVESLRTLTLLSWRARFIWCLSVAALWVACEMVQARFLTGFPWGLLGVSQYRMLPIIQVAGVTGVYGVSFLLIWFSCSLLCAATLLLCNPAARRTWMADLFVPILTVAILFAMGMHRVLHTAAAPRQIKVALIQPSIPQTMIWDESEAMTRFEQVLEWSGKALGEQPRPDLLVWPEAAVPGFFLWDTNVYKGKSIYDWITGFARDHQIWMVMGADDAEPLPDHKVNYYNSSFLINPEGEVLAKYRKRRLVIFGEYVPFSRWLPFLTKMVQSEGEFTPGDKPVAFRLNSLNVVTSVLICFEDIFPHLTREYVQSDTDFLLNLTNNGWFGESAAQWQHAASAVFRAIENNLPLVRCANNGLTCWVDRRGNMHNVYYADSKNIYKAGYKIVDVPVGSSEKYAPTFYRKHGDLFGWLCCGVAGIAAVRVQLRSRRNSRSATHLPAAKS